VRRLINRLIKVLAQLCPVSVPRKTSLISPQGLPPLMAVMPVAIYAYATMVVVTAKSESHYRELAKQSLQTLAYRLKRPKKHRQQSVATTPIGTISMSKS
jgi:hypothetical protein